MKKKNTWNDRTANKCVVFSECESVTFAAIRAAYTKQQRRREKQKIIRESHVAGFVDFYFSISIKSFHVRLHCQRGNVCQPLQYSRVPHYLVCRLNWKWIKKYSRDSRSARFYSTFSCLLFRVAHSIRFHVFLKLLFLRFLLPPIWFLIISATTTTTTLTSQYDNGDGCGRQPTGNKIKKKYLKSFGAIGNNFVQINNSQRFTHFHLLFYIPSSVIFSVDYSFLSIFSSSLFYFRLCGGACTENSCTNIFVSHDIHLIKIKKSGSDIKINGIYFSVLRRRCTRWRQIKCSSWKMNANGMAKTIKFTRFTFLRQSLSLLCWIFRCDRTDAEGGRMAHGMVTKTLIWVWGWGFAVQFT